MEKDIMIPQGEFQVGRDIHEGVYLIAALNELSYVTIENDKDNNRYYTLDEEDSARVLHVELKKGEVLTIYGKVKMRLITRFIEGEHCNLLEEVETFEKELQWDDSAKKYSDFLKEQEESEEDSAADVEEEAEEKPPKRRRRLGFWGVLGVLAGVGSSHKKHLGKCDGDCANCPPHYGYRHGRWYYGHHHVEGCEFGGNKGGGRD